MKRNESGFTLIELLVVIVILAIIALIAVPVVMNIITKSRKSAFKDSAYGIIKAGELYYADRLLEPDGMTEDKMFIFPDDIIGLDLKGSQPSSGSVIVTKEGKVAIAISNGKYCAKKLYDGDVVISEEPDNCLLPFLSQLATTGTFTKVDGSDEKKISEVHECAMDKTEGACAPGTAFAIKVNEKDIYRFFVLSDSGEKVTLIMDRNLGNNVAWYAAANNNTFGPITALTALQDRTSAWTNLPEITTNTFEYDNGVEKSLAQTFTMYARLPKNSELKAVNNSTALTNTPWLYINLKNTGNASTSGYWTSTAIANSSYSHVACYVYFDGYVKYTDFGVAVGGRSGVRPVIELQK